MQLGLWSLILFSCMCKCACIYVYGTRLVVTYLKYGQATIKGSLKLLVSFAKGPYKRDDILQKRPIILRSLLIVATPYV